VSNSFLIIFMTFPPKSTYDKLRKLDEDE
jgi:hypothetical protein